MAIATAINFGTSSRSSSAISIASGASIVVFTDGNLVDLEHIYAERSYDGGSNYRPVPDAIVCDNDKQEGRIYGPITTLRLTISDTAAARTVYTDS